MDPRLSVLASSDQMSSGTCQCLPGKTSVQLQHLLACKVADYIDQFLFDNNDHLIIRHILGLYNNMYCSREWRNNILDKSFFKLKGDKLRFATDKIEKMISLRQAA